MDFKNTLVKSITAVLCVLAICITMVSVVGDYSEATIEASKSMGGAPVSENGGADASDDAITDDTGVSDENATIDDGTVTDETPADDGTSTDAPAADETPSQQAPAGDKTPADSNKPAANAMPKTTAEIVSFYNSAVSKAVSSKVGFNKSRVTDNEKMDGSAALKLMKDLVYKFMGIGAENEYKEKVEKGKWGDVSFLFNSKLTANDVTSASCTASGANYVVTINLKPGSSSAGKSNPSSPANSALDKCGLCVGSEDKGYFDHKTASVIYDAIAGTYAGAEIKESYSNATVKATINASTGNIVSLVVEWNQAATLSKLAGMSATASGISHVRFTDFKY